MPDSPPAGIRGREHWLDALAKRLATRASRRRALAGAGAGLIGGVLASLLPRRAQGYAQGAPCGPGGSCPPGETCVAGLCLGLIPPSPCPRGSSECGGQCVNTQADPNHCGGCGTQCSYGVPCTAGACTVEVLSAPACANTVTDPNNCGRCGNVCPAPQWTVAVCNNGVCGLACAPGSKLCGGACISATNCCTDADCGPQSACISGACQAGAPPQPDCTATATKSASGGNPAVSLGSVTAIGIGTGGIALSLCSSVPGPPIQYGAGFALFDVKTTPGSAFTQIQLQFCGPDAGNAVVWLLGGVWQPTYPDAFVDAGTGCLVANLDDSSVPSVGQLTGSQAGHGVATCGLQGLSSCTKIIPCPGFFTLCGSTCCDTRDHKCCGNVDCVYNNLECCPNNAPKGCNPGTCCGPDQNGLWGCCFGGTVCMQQDRCLCDRTTCAPDECCAQSPYKRDNGFGNSTFEPVGCKSFFDQSPGGCGKGGDICQPCPPLANCTNGECICTTTGFTPFNGSCCPLNSSIQNGQCICDSTGKPPPVFSGPCPGQTCDATTCLHGCCDGVTCVPGTNDNNACGQGGNQCFACTGGSTCVNGNCICPGSGVLVSAWGGGWCPCVPPCTSGCCDVNMVCRPGNTNAACGTLGGACFTCPDGGQSCQGGACGGVCQGRCAPGSCGNGQCCASSATGPGCDECCCGAPRNYPYGPVICYGSCGFSDPDCPARYA
jgi:hypothetical protein